MSLPLPAQLIARSSAIASAARELAANGAAAQTALQPLEHLALPAWQDLHARAIEPNAYYDPLWAIAVARSAPGRGGARALLAWHPTDNGHLTGYLPVRSAWRALKLPIPMLVAWNAYAPLCIPTLDRDHAVAAARALLQAARANGASALFLPDAAVEGAAFGAFRQAAGETGCSVRILRSSRRAALNAMSDAETVLRNALGQKKLKELRRQRHRLEDEGALRFQVASTPDTVANALEQFLQLEAAGWKGRAGTAMLQHEGEAAFVRNAAIALSAKGRLEIMSLVRNGETIASGIVLRDKERAYFFKIAMDEREARNSPGVQLTLDITRQLCGHPDIAFVDSTATARHAMIDRIWRERIVVADVFISLHAPSALTHGMILLMQGRHHLFNGMRRLKRLMQPRR